jgi:hypothetical protein
MWNSCVAVLSVVALAGVPAKLAAPAAPAVTVQDRLAADASVDVLLEALHQRGLNLVDFDADVKLTESDQSTGNDTIRTGRALYHKPADPADGGAVVRVKFDTRDEGSGPKPYVREYLLSGQWLTERDYKRKTETKTQVLRPGQQVNLLKLGEGPFPLPIGQEPDAVKKQFAVTLLAPEAGVPRLQLVPTPGTKLANKFSEIVVSIDPATRFPTVIKTTDRTKSTIRTTELTNLRVNPQPGLTDGDFALPAVGADWKIAEQPLED